MIPGKLYIWKGYSAGAGIQLNLWKLGPENTVIRKMDLNEVFLFRSVIREPYVEILTADGLLGLITVKDSSFSLLEASDVDPG